MTNDGSHLTEISQSHKGLASKGKVIRHHIPKELVHAFHTTFLAMGISSHMTRLA